MTSFLSALASAAGIVAFAAVLLWLSARLIRRARSSGLLWPFAVGAGLRLAVMVTAHAGSLLAGGDGTFYVDDVGYRRAGASIAHQWLGGHIINPVHPGFAGSYHFGYQTLLGTVFTAVGPSVLAMKLVSVLLGSATVLMTGLIAERLFDEVASRRAAWLTALMPTAIWWSAVGLKEAFATALVVAAFLSLTRLSGRAGFVQLGLALAALAVTRSPAVASIVLTCVVLVVLSAWRHRSTVDWSSVARWTGMVLALTLGFVVLLAGGNPRALVLQYQGVIQTMAHAYGGGGPVLFNVPKSLVAPYPWVFGRSTLTWDRALYPGMWVWYALLPTAAVGAWRLRRRVEGVALVLPIAALLTLNGFTAGFTFRQRSTVEPFLLLLVAVGIDSWPATARRGALGLAVISLFAVAQSRSPVVGGVIVAVAAALAALARWLPAGRAPSVRPVGRLDFLAEARLPSPGQALSDTVLALARVRALAPSARGATEPAGQTGGPGRLIGRVGAALRTAAPAPTAREGGRRRLPTLTRVPRR